MLSRQVHVHPYLKPSIIRDTVAKAHFFRIAEINDRVSLKDLDMQGWFPIFRSEPVSFVRKCVEEEPSIIRDTVAKAHFFRIAEINAVLVILV